MRPRVRSLTLNVNISASRTKQTDWKPQYSLRTERLPLLTEENDLGVLIKSQSVQAAFIWSFFTFKFYKINDRTTWNLISRDCSLYVRSTDPEDLQGNSCHLGMYKKVFFVKKELGFCTLFFCFLFRACSVYPQKFTKIPDNTIMQWLFAFNFYFLWKNNNNNFRENCK